LNSTSASSDAHMHENMETVWIIISAYPHLHYVR
jgi:uncharacterized RmlC-like cupin family protein